MRLATTVWMSAALLVATSALHLTIEHDLLGNQHHAGAEDNRVEPSATTTERVIELDSKEKISQESTDEETKEQSAERPSESNSNEKAPGSSSSTENLSRMNEFEEVNIETGDQDDSEPDDDNVSDTTGNGEPEAGGNGGPDTDNDSETDAGGNEEPEDNGNGDSDAADGGEPDSGGNGEPETGGNGEPETGGNGEPDTGDSGEPDTDGIGEPDTDGIGEPDTDGIGEPDTDGIGEPDTDGNGEPESGGNGVPDTGGNGNPDTGGNGEPDTGGNGEPDTGGNGEPDGGGNNGADGETDSGDGNDVDNTIIQTTTGPVRGHMWRENANIISYIDIKYGTFNSVFEAPVSPDPWESVHEVRDHSKRCPQIQDDLVVGDTDCLTLSILKPSNAANSSVLVHIHEGNFKYGSANPMIYGPEYLVSKGIILVLPNYRLGPLGFLCLQNETAQGNAALKDLTLALSWVSANIAEFGGDPANIAVSGDGTAGALAGYLALSAMSKDYISKVITESGSVLSYWALDRQPIDTAANLVRNINGFETWQEVETSILVTAAKDIALRPCLESNTSNAGHFMVETPWTMIVTQETNISFMTGSAMYAGAHELLMHTEDSLQQLNDDVALLLPNDLQFETAEEKNTFGNRVKSQYFDETAISLSDVDKLSLYFTDVAYLSPGIRTARQLVDSGATVYFYEFSFVGELNRELEAIHRPVQGAVMGDIVGYLFTQDGVVPSPDTTESRMVDQLMELWTTFLNTGIPSAENIVWNKLEKATDSEEEWLSIETETSLQRGLHVERLSLWTEMYDQHFIERNLALNNAPCVYTMLVLQLIFWIGFFKNASHLY